MVHYEAGNNLPGEEKVKDLAGRILELDNSILSVGVIDLKTGKTISRAMKDAFIEKYAKDEGMMDKSGIWVTIATSVLEQLDDLFSEGQSIVLLRKDINQLILPISSRSMIVTASFEHTIDGRIISNKIRKYLGL
jgi:hypothetical protein